MAIAPLYKKLTLSAIISFLALCLFGQKEMNIWYFGHNAGLDFNSGVPVALTNSQMSTNEGCSVISDKNGSLLFYTDGGNVWDKTHTVMPNGTGLKGNFSSAQSAVIVPKPGSNTIYYIFTMSVGNSADGLQYSEVDLSLNGGNGDVTTVKNVQLVAGSAEKLTAVHHDNKNDIWVVTQKGGTNEYHAFLVTSAGVNTTAVVSNIGSPNGGFGADGYLKFSPDGKKIANALFSLKATELFSFNSNNGTISNMISLPTTNGLGPYGVEFSPNSNLLYVAVDPTGTPTQGELLQYDISSLNQATIQSTKTSIPITNAFPTHPYALQLGPDKKIYVANITTSNTTKAISVINDPDVIGLGCNYQESTIDLGGKDCFIGLPQFIQSYFFESTISYTGICFDDTTFFTSSFTNPPDSLLWDFGVTSLTTDSSTSLNPYYIYPDTGTYDITLYSWFNNIPDTATETITITGKFHNEINDTVLCAGNSIVLDATVQNANYQWFDGSTNSSLSVNTTGIKWVDISLNGCTVRDSIVVDNIAVQGINDTLLCPNSSVILDATQPETGVSYLWKNGATTPSITVSTTDTVWVDITKNTCSYRDSVIVEVLADVNLGNDTTLCSPENFSVAVPTIPNQNPIYIWSDGSGNASITINGPDTVWVDVIVKNCLMTDTIKVNMLSFSDLGNDTTLCPKETLLLDMAMDDNTNYLWSDNSTDDNLLIEEAGKYKVTLTNNHCSYKDSINVTYFNNTLNLGKDTVLCDTTYNLTLRANASGNYVWSTGEVSPSIVVNKDDWYWVIVNDANNCSYNDSINVSSNIPHLSLGGDTAICVLEELEILPNNINFKEYSWSTGASSPSIFVNEAGVYSLIIEDDNSCIARDSIIVELNSCELYLPNAFTPNEDGVNDIFYAVGHPVDEIDLFIFDRWGSKVGEIHHITDGWSGKIDGKPLPQGVYNYVVSYKFVNDPNGYTKRGVVTLVR